MKDVVDNIEVAPVSPMDDRIRLAEARAIYGAPQLNKYAIDPAKPIRITVVNGNVTLVGVVDNQGGQGCCQYPGEWRSRRLQGDQQSAGGSAAEPGEVEPCCAGSFRQAAHERCRRGLDSFTMEV